MQPTAKKMCAFGNGNWLLVAALLIALITEASIASAQTLHRQKRTTAKAQAAQAGERQPDRTVLPIQMPSPPTYTEMNVRSVKQKPGNYQVKAPAGAPNVVIVLIDDMGFGAPSTFGGPVQMPTIDRLSQTGLRYNNFQTTALCSPTGRKRG